ncbi:MAG TPA: alpha/beta hydrolase fold domain-containing protein [Sphingomonadaceae bacterium]|nr:alpha/beta hydrolase fold domain-containing protein [Sphingomonadaceae bacterium]
MAATAALAEGIARYVALFGAQPAADGYPALRLVGDLLADRFAEGHAPAVRRFDTAIAVAGREIAVRLHDPGGPGLRPAICYIHGGGFTLGSIESFDLATAALAEATGAVVASVHYRRLPDSPYQAAQADCDQAFAWLTRNAAALAIDPARILLAGDSAGALMALACAANARDAGAPIRPAGLLLFYGTFAMDPDRPAYRDAGDPLLTQPRIATYIGLFVANGGLAAHPAPLDRDDLAGLPPTHIVAAEHDPLRDEAGELAARLAAAGVAVTHRVAPGMIHGFLRAVGVSGPARAELAMAAVAVRPILWPSANEKQGEACEA